MERTAPGDPVEQAPQHCDGGTQPTEGEGLTPLALEQQSGSENEGEQNVLVAKQARRSDCEASVHGPA
jgi:hypothetical protein